MTGVLAVPVALASATAQAHPHSWIDLTVTVPFDAGGEAIGLREVWLFDEYYTAFVLEGVATGADGQPDQAFLEFMLHQNIANLAEYDYFTTARQGDAPVALGTVTEMSTTMRENRLEITFLVPFRTPVDVAAAPLTYAIFDPTYYVEMLHAETPEPVRLENAPADCRHRLTPPDPDPDAVSLAASLDATQSAGDGLGQLFAERVEIRCD